MFLTDIKNNIIQICNTAGTDVKYYRQQTFSVAGIPENTIYEIIAADGRSLKKGNVERNIIREGEQLFY